MPPHPTTVFVALLIFFAALLVIGWAVFNRPSALDRARRAIAAGDYAAARPWAEKALRRANHDLDRALALDELAAVHRFMGANDEAEDCYREALSIREEHLDPADGDIGASLHNLALCLMTQARFTDAEPLYREAVALLRPARGDDHESVALALMGLGQACMFNGKFVEAEELLGLSYRLTERAFGRNHPRTAEVLLQEANCAAVRGKFHPSDRAFRICREIYDEVHPADHPAALIAAQQHANLLVGWFRLTGDAAALAEAADLTEAFVERATTGFGPAHHLTAAGLRSLARVRTLQGRAGEAVGHAREAVRIIEAVLGPDHMRSGLKRLTLARALDAAGELAESRDNAERARDVYERTFGPDHFEVGDVYETLGRLAGRRREYEAAEELLRQSLQLREPLGRMHPLRAFTLRELAPVLRELGRDAEAEVVEEEIAAITAAAHRE